MTAGTYSVVSQSQGVLFLSPETSRTAAGWSVSISTRETFFPLVSSVTFLPPAVISKTWERPGAAEDSRSEETARSADTLSLVLPQPESSARERRSSIMSRTRGLSGSLFCSARITWAVVRTREERMRPPQAASPYWRPANVSFLSLSLKTVFDQTASSRSFTCFASPFFSVRKRERILACEYRS